jgi:glycosyltransferase involved in cell wall biosynthesis
MPDASPGTAAPFVDDTAGSHPIRVLWLIKGLGRGGAELLLLHAAEVRDRDRFNVEVAYLLPHKDALVEDLRAAGVRVHLLGMNGEFDLRWTGRLRRLVRQRRFDIVHVHSAYVASFARLALRSMPRRPRILVTEHLTWNGYPWPTRIANRLTFGLDDGHLAVSEAVQASIRHRSRKVVRPLIHGIPLDHVRGYADSRLEVRAELGVGPDEVLIGTVANYRVQKGYPLLLAAARELLDRDQPVRFVAVGSGPEESHILSQHRALDLGDRFRLLASRDDAVRIVAAMDVFVLASHYEGLPLVVMEAMSLGVPVVATAVGGLPELLTDTEEGLLVPPGRSDLIADAIASLVADPERRARMGAAGAASSIRFDHRRAVRTIEAMYAELAVSH